jgi:hypothetical protein
MAGRNEMWMDESEQASWRAYRGLGDEVATPETAIKKAATQKLTVNKLNLMLLDAAANGNMDMAIQAMADGAKPNARARANPGDTPFTLAVERGHDKMALMLLKAGSWPAPSRWSAAPSGEFDSAAAAGVFSEPARAELAAKALSLFANYGKDFSVFKQVRDWCSPRLDDTALLALAISQDRYDLALKGTKIGALMTAEVWSKGIDRLQWRYSGIKDHPHNKDLVELATSPSTNQTITTGIVEGLYRAAIVGDDPELALALLDAGLRPNKKWVISKRPSYGRSDEKIEEPLLTMAAALDRPQLFDLFKKCPPALAAACSEPALPQQLIHVPIGRLMELRDIGVDIEGADKDGNALPHLWAKLDREPRDGWATLAKKVPSLFSKRDAQGRCASDVMASKLSGQEKDEFLASLSRIESREIKSELGPKSKKMAPPVRSRL